MYVKIIDGAVAEYPYSPGKLIADNPQTSFPMPLSDSTLNAWGVMPVVATPEPVHDPLTQSVVQLIPVLVDGHWQQAFEIIPYVPAPVLEVARAQAKHALLQAGLLDAVEALVPTMGRAAQIDWADRPTVHRSNAWVIEAQAAMGWTDAQLDDLFNLAGTL